MWSQIGSIALKYWVDFLFGLIVAGGGIFLKRYMKLAKAEREKERTEYYSKLTEGIKAENKTMVEALEAKYEAVDKKVEDKYEEVTENFTEAMAEERAESKADDAKIQSEVSTMSDELSALKAGLLSMQGKEFRASCRALLAEDHEITLDEWEEIDADHEAYNGLGGNHKGDHLYDLVKKKAENTLTD